MAPRRKTWSHLHPLPLSDPSTSMPVGSLSLSATRSYNIFWERALVASMDGTEIPRVGRSLIALGVETSLWLRLRASRCGSA